MKKIIKYLYLYRNVFKLFNSKSTLNIRNTCDMKITILLIQNLVFLFYSRINISIEKDGQNKLKKEIM